MKSYFARRAASNEPHREQAEPELVGGFKSSRVLLFSVHLGLICSDASNLAQHLVPDEGGKKRGFWGVGRWVGGS